MCTCGSMKPGKTYLPAASITSAPAGGERLRPIAAIVSPSQRISAVYWSVAVVIWPFLIKSGMAGLARSRDDCFRVGGKSVIHFGCWASYRHSLSRTRLIAYEVVAWDQRFMVSVAGSPGRLAIGGGRAEDVGNRCGGGGFFAARHRRRDLHAGRFCRSGRVGDRLHVQPLPDGARGRRGGQG